MRPMARPCMPARSSALSRQTGSAARQFRRCCGHSTFPSGKLDRASDLCVNCACILPGGNKIKQLKKYLAMILIIAVLMVAAICASTLYQSYRQIRLAAVANASNVTLIAQRAISRNIEMLSLSLDTLAYRYQHPLGGKALPESQSYAYLFGSTANASHITVMAVIDAQGQVRATSRRSATQARPNYADRAYFTVHRDHAETGLYISRPIQASLGNELPVVVLSKRLSRQDGSFDGIVVMALDLAYFRDLFMGLTLGEEGVISL